MSEKAADHNVFILGAGASVDAGAPLITDFLDRARELYDNPISGLATAERDHFRAVFDFRRKMAQAREKIRIDLDNIEQLFGLVEMSRRLDTTGQGTRASTVYLIAKTLELAVARHSRIPEVSFDVTTGVNGCSDAWKKQIATRSERFSQIFPIRPGFSPPKFGVPLYAFFAALVSGMFDDPDRVSLRRNTVITFNYDLVLDNAFTRLGVHPNYCIGSQVTAAQSIDLLKLHGSTNWASCAQCGRVVIFPDKFTTLEAFASIKPECGHERLQPLLVPPSWDKSEYRDIVQPVWRAAERAVETATRIIVVGYSMPETDTFFKYLITLGLAENHQLYRFIVVDKDDPPNISAMLGDDPPDKSARRSLTESIRVKFERLLEPIFRSRRFSYDGGGFAHFLATGGTYRLINRGEILSDTGY